MSEPPSDHPRRDEELWGWGSEKAEPEPTAPYSQPSQPPGQQPYQPPGQPPYSGSYQPGQPGYQPPGAYGSPPPYAGAPYAGPPAPWPGYGYGPPAMPPPPNEGRGVAALVVGIVSLFLACGYGVGLLGSPVALFLGRSSMKRIDASEGRLGGRGMAQAGFVLGIVGTVLLVLLIALIGFGVFALFQWGDTTGTGGSGSNV